MRGRNNGRGAEPLNRYYVAAKISEYQFKKLLWNFAHDISPTETSRHMRLSLNSVNAIYMKIRRYFVELGHFPDIQVDQEELEFSDEIAVDSDEAFIRFHRNRMSRKYGLVKNADIHGLHRCESCWRYVNLELLNDGRDTNIPRMMYRDLIALIRICGPLGSPITNLDKALEYRRQRVEQRLLWLQRNSTRHKSVELRALLTRLKENWKS